MADQNDFLVSWLNDAYAMENSIVQKLEEHIKDIDEDRQMKERMPEMREKVVEHLNKTKQHAEMAKSCIERLGGGVSSVKSGLAAGMGVMEGKTASLAKDTIVKNTLAEYTTEHMEIASYNALIAAAQELGDQDTVTVCEAILADEEEMAGWLSEQLPNVVQEFLRFQE